MTSLADAARRLLALAEAEARYDAEWNDKWGDGFEDFDPVPKKYLTACSPETIASLCRAYLDMERDAERMDWLSNHLLAADFEYEHSNTKCALIIEWPRNVSVGGSLRANVDAAIDAARKG